MTSLTPPTRTSPALSMYEQDVRDAEKLSEGFQSAIEWMRKNGTLPARRERRNQRAAAVANDN